MPHEMRANKNQRSSTCLSLLFLNVYFIYLFLAVLGFCCFSLVVASRGYCLVEMHGFLIAVASLVAEHRL